MVVQLKMAFSFGGNTTGAASTATPAFNFGASAPAASTTTGFGFGTSNTAATAPTTSTGFSFGGAPATTTPSTTTTPGFSFGSATQPAATTTSTTPKFSFGGSGTTPGAATFGFGSTTSQTPATTGFGSTTASASSGFSFGGTTTGQSSGLGGFGTSNNTQSTGLFGKPATTSGFGSFGATSSVFGSSTGTSGFGATAPAQPQAPAVSLDMRYDALPADVQKQIKDFDQFLKDQSREEASIQSVSAQPLADLQDATTQLEQVALVMRNIQARQAKDIQTLKCDVKDVVSKAEAADQIHIYLTSDTGIQRQDEMPSGYYWHLVRNFEQRMQTLKSQINDVHMQLQGLQQARHGAAAQQHHPTPQLLQQILQSQNDAFMKIAAHVATTHEQAEILREKYLATLEQSKQQLDGKVRNPFDAADRIQAEEERRIVDRIRLSAAQVTFPAASPGSTATTGGTPASSSLFSFSTPAATTTTPSAFGAPATTTTSAFSTPATSAAFGAPSTSAFGAPAVTTGTGAPSAFGGFAQPPTLTKSVSFAGLAAPDATGGVGMPAANALNPKSVRRKASSSKKR
ncbi:hypothetical protein H310_02775 [Aphanomyces invadans]|uniref:Nucleoporin Nup54 alpha-helical domain-containing protein n=1 Tax=Aphanomyces invadans TaxID=157072 RepID=A0A024ULR1_9STRA|nr:hypothetical protein H310_02775 [Aphanomyces invadans]ETW06548.1 hypothetical protein H310_02775 [Aphanomyces invadans]|eukprot:XP_008864623.1 hypothetical protein H310_02775 [Aphanomyces invadans]